MAMSTRRMKDKGKGKIGDMEVQEKRLVSQGTPNSANDLASKYGDPNKITRGDIITAAIENQKKKKMA